MSDWLAKIIDVTKTVGVPSVVCAVVMWFAYETITWEREQMLPALQDTAMALEKNSTALEGVEKVLEKLEAKP